MDTDRLKDLLQEADASAPPGVALPTDLAARVLRRAQRGRVYRLSTVSAVAAVLLVALLVRWPGRSPRPAVPDRGPAVATLVPTPSALASLSREADTRRAIAQQLVQIEASKSHMQEQAARLAAVTMPPEPRELAQRETARAAETLVRHGYELEKKRQDLVAAAAVYRDAVRLFPATTWAEVARVRLVQLEESKGATS